MNRAADVDETSSTGPRPSRSQDASTAVAAVALLVAGIISLVLAVVLPINQLTQQGGAVPVWLAAQPAERALAVVDLPPDTFLTAESEQAVLTLQVAELPWQLRLLTEAPAAVTALCTGLGALVLYQLLGTFRAGRPFERRNPRRLAVLAALVVGGGIGGQTLETLARLTVLDHVDATPDAPFQLAGTLSLTPVVLSVVLFALADAFRRGVRLTDDVQGLV